MSKKKSNLVQDTLDQTRKLRDLADSKACGDCSEDWVSVRDGYDYALNVLKRMGDVHEDQGPDEAAE